MAILSGLFHQESDLEQAVDLLYDAGFSHLSISSQNQQKLPIPGGFLVTNLLREPNTESNFGINPGVPVPVFQPVPENAYRIFVSVGTEQLQEALSLMKRTKARQIQIQ